MNDTATRSETATCAPATYEPPVVEVVSAEALSEILGTATCVTTGPV